jgi:hypothetical protein
LLLSRELVCVTSPCHAHLSHDQAIINLPAFCYDKKITWFKNALLLLLLSLFIINSKLVSFIERCLSICKPIIYIYTHTRSIATSQHHNIRQISHPKKKPLYQLCIPSYPPVAKSQTDNQSNPSEKKIVMITPFPKFIYACIAFLNASSSCCPCMATCEVILCGTPVQSSPVRSVFFYISNPLSISLPPWRPVLVCFVWENLVNFSFFLSLFQEGREEEKKKKKVRQS